MTAFEQIEEVADRHLHILWTNADPDTSEHMVMMYATKGMLRGWWDQITVIICGATQKYVINDEAIRARMDIAKKAGVTFSACIGCAVNLGTKDALEEMGIEVTPWGERIALLQQEGKHLLSI